MKIGTFFASFAVLIVGALVAWNTYSKYQDGIGIIYYIQQNGLDVPAGIGLLVGLLVAYGLFFKGRGDKE